MGFWILSIIIVVALAIGIGYGLYGITKLCFKHFDKTSGEVFGGFSGFSIGVVGIIVIFLSMMNSCTSKYTTYEESFLDSMPYYFIIVGVIILGFFIWYFISNKKDLANKHKEEVEFIKKYGVSKQEFERREKEDKKRQLEVSLQERECLLNSLAERFGEDTAKFNFAKASCDSWGFEARIYEQSQMIIVIKNNKIVDELPFSSIINFSKDEEITTIGNAMATTTTTTSTGSMVKRGLVGGILLGGVGALAGAATAKQTSETIIEDKEERRFYSITLNIDSLSYPLYSMYFGQDSQLCKKVEGLLIAILRRNQKNPENREVSKIVLSEASPKKDIERDPLFEEAARIVVNSGTASTSYLQRRFSIGYNRAGAIMDQLEAAGIVGISQGGKPRPVLVDSVGLEDILHSY